MKDKDKYIYVSVAVPRELWAWLAIYGQARGLKPSQALRVLLSERRMREEAGMDPVVPGGGEL